MEPAQQAEQVSSFSRLERRARLRAAGLLLRELPLLVGIALGIWQLSAAGRLFIFTLSPVGFDWSEYLQAAWMVVHRENHGYPGFRNPLYPYLLGVLGESLGSYPHSAVLLASSGTVLLVISAALGGRALASPTAGGLAAASIPWVTDTALASRWTNLYPLLGGTTGMAIALGVATFRWPRAWLALLTGFFAGLAWGIDNRALPFALTSFLLCILSSARARGFVRVLLPLAFVPGVLIGPISQKWLALDEPVPLVQQLKYQRENELRGIPGAGIEPLRAACEHEPPEELPSLEALQRPCARALLRHNLDMLQPSFPFRLWPTLLFLPFLLLPARRGWLDGLVSLLAGLAAVAPLLLMSLWVMVPDRYVLQFAALIALIVPVALSRILFTVSDRLWSRLLEGGLAIAAFVLLATGIDHGPRREPLERDGRYVAMARLQIELRRTVGSEDTLLDCSAQGVETALLPRQYHKAPPNLTGFNTIRCMAWLSEPERHDGDAFVVTGVRCPFPLAPPGSLEASDTSKCSACIPVPGPSMEVPCPHGLKVGMCSTCRNTRVNNEHWELLNWYYSGYSCLDTLMLWRFRKTADAGSDPLPAGP